MIRITFAIFAFICFVQLVSSQDACETAGDAITDSCAFLLNFANPAVCTGVCGGPLAAAASACANSNDPEIQILVAAYYTACNSSVQCQDALTAFNAATNCVAAITTDETSVSCSETCENVVNAALNNCPDNAFTSYQRQGYNELCGSGSVLQASGIITLLLVAASAVIF